MSTAIEWWRPGWRERFLASLEVDHMLPEDVISEAPPRPSGPAPARTRKPLLGGAARPYGGALSRFYGTSHHANRKQAALPIDHPAMVERRSLFPRSVISAAASPRILVSGFNSAKIGARIQKGAWRGLPVYTVTLEERATCPDSCTLLRECYGNAMPFARRHAADPDLIERLGRELRAKARKHPDGFAVRLHVLGDFPSAEYALAWFRWMNAIPQLHVWGYTAHTALSQIGSSVLRGNGAWPGRWVFRTSVDPSAPAGAAQAATIWRAGARGRQPEGIVCPAQTGGTAACATCGLCWAPAALGERILFVGHGKRGRPSAQANR